MTQEEIDMMRSSKTEDEWAERCNKVKAAHGGEYPADWHEKIIASGVLRETAASFGGSDAIVIL